ncbi:MAG TPA: hypothetical protein VK787_15500, partial [Puia sp.]|nr:hypothetical protein [Puia sp.]
KLIFSLVRNQPIIKDVTGVDYAAATIFCSLQPTVTNSKVYPKIKRSIELLLCKSATQQCLIALQNPGA